MFKEFIRSNTLLLSIIVLLMVTVFWISLVKVSANPGEDECLSHHWTYSKTDTGYRCDR
jgi:hypothetical protein